MYPAEGPTCAKLETYERGQLEVSRWPLAKGRWSASCGPRFCMGSGALSKQFGIKFTFSYFEITVCTLHTCIVDECTKLLAGARNARRSAAACTLHCNLQASRFQTSYVVFGAQQRSTFNLFEKQVSIGLNVNSLAFQWVHVTRRQQVRHDTQC